ncbi:hypothetical protein [Chamaesiphon sp. OTE_75_metabat_556]|uniref:hypothetical protein n=1 Tax=Chamaesiphon sp. OTE_75_metabat_556 TaxID=2964692 RepID=UPI00286B1A70|nr:hypothetical protein [Chamaesiphon sp. OTE_75_metabat_556]
MEGTRATISSIDEWQATSTSKTDNIKILWRGVDSKHLGEGVYGRAQQGIAKPQGGHSNAADHSLGETDSVFTSWTSDISQARYHATKRSGQGIILEKNFDLSKTKYVRSDVADALYQENEFLIRGTIFGAKVIKVEGMYGDY